MIEKKVVSKKVAIALGIVCVVLLVLLVGNVYTLSSQISSLNSQVESLENENLSLKSEISAKDNTIASLNFQIAEKDDAISSLNSQTASLNSQIAELQSQKDNLQKWLQGNITYYESQINSLNSQVQTLMNQRDRLKAQNEELSLWLEGNKTLLAQTQTWLQTNITYYTSQVNSLNSQIANLRNQISSLNAKISTLQAYVNAYQKLIDEVNHRWNQINVEPFVTPQDQAVSDIVYSITGGWSNPSDWDEFWKDIKVMYDWVADNIEYRYDGLYPILPEDPSGELRFWNEMWQFPNETLSLRKGDCEDIAILLCSMIRCYSNSQYYTEVIMIVSGTSGHAAVQLPVKGYKLVILDPAGRYYSRDFWGNIAFNDITTEINNWLNYWKPKMGTDVYVRRVFSDHVDKTFTSTSKYIEWMYSR